MADTGFDPGLALIYVVLPPGGDVARVEALVDEELAKAVRAGISAAELAKARNQQLAGFWRSLATISGKAQALGGYEIFHGDHAKLFDAPTRFDAVSEAQVKALAAKTFRKANRTIGVLQPQPAAADKE